MEQEQYLLNTNIASATDCTAANAMIDALFDAAKQLDANYVPTEGRKCFIKIGRVLQISKRYKRSNVDFSVVNGSIAEGKVVKIAGIELIPAAHFVDINVNSADQIQVQRN